MTASDPIPQPTQIEVNTQDPKAVERLRRFSSQAVELIQLLTAHGDYDPEFVEQVNDTLSAMLQDLDRSVEVGAATMPVTISTVARIALVSSHESADTQTPEVTINLDTEEAILAFFTSNQGELFSRVEIIKAVFGKSFLTGKPYNDFETLLQSLIDRGLIVSQPRLFGSKAPKEKPQSTGTPTKSVESLSKRIEKAGIRSGRPRTHSVNNKTGRRGGARTWKT
ncbi:TPA: hypothetical protein DIV49_01970 [Candidatus Saccharibacteria bacterium]|nr:hypothetical protein [Candidatus Saccharibacteria bacterium]HRJ90712.1 hypothetical protein [Candidatus Saccharibacteria bacterium]